MQLLRNEEKNALLRRERGISFEDIQVAIEEDCLIDILDHHNKLNYPNQQLLLINRREYIYVVPFVEQIDGSFFLKTIYPSSIYTKLYL